jgi:hypothetical protein
MAEVTPTPKPKTKPKKKAVAAAPPSPPPDSGLLSTWRVWAVAGVLLVGSVVAWKLIGASYKSDVETICNAEKGSGFAGDKDMPKVTQWARDRLGTPEGNELFSSLSDTPKHADKAKLLQAKASELKIDCPLVASIQKLAAEGEYRSDIQHLCSRVSFPRLDEMTDDARVARMKDWIDNQAKSPRTKELGDALVQAAPGDRSKVLSDAVSKMDGVNNCENTKVLGSPVVPPKAKGPPAVRPYAAPQVIGSMGQEDVAKALADATPAMNQCYAKGLEKNADLEGRMAVKVQVDPAGKVTNVGLADTKVPDKDTTACILQALREMHMPKNPGPLVSLLFPLELTTMTGGGPTQPGRPGALTAPGGLAPSMDSSAPSPGGPAPSARPR